MKLSFFSLLCTRLLSSSVSEFQAQEEHWLLHPADLHALDPDHHPVLGVLLDQLRRFCCPCGSRWDIWACDVGYCWWRCLLGCLLGLWWFLFFCLPLIVVKYSISDWDFAKMCFCINILVGPGTTSLYCAAVMMASFFRLTYVPVAQW